MKKYISKNIINEIISKTNIVDIIKLYIQIKKKGRNYKACCPFHNEKIPSFTVNEERQFYYCFGCHASGNVIDFLINYEKLNFIETIEYLAKNNNISISYYKNLKYSNNIYIKRENLFLYIKKLSKFYQNNLIKNTSAKKYLQKRNINNKMLKLFKIGFSSENFSKKYINTNKNQKTQKILINLGILIKNTNGFTYDLLYNRIIFPIQNKYGKIIGFGGRSINNNIPKYLNSSETEIFNKKNQLYGLYQVLQKSNKPKKIIVVEGYLDVIKLFQIKIKYAVAILGTAINYKHIEILLQYTKEIIFCYDGDEAGIKAAWNTVQIILPYINDENNIKFIFLPKGYDPDKIINLEGKNKFKKRIKYATNLSIFLFKKLLKKQPIQSIEEKTIFSSKIIPLINKIPSKIMRFYLYNLLEKTIGILNINKFNNYIIKKNKIKNLKKKNIYILISLLIQNPKLINIIPSILEINYLKYKGIKIFKELLIICLKKKNITTGQILEIYRNQKIFKILKILSTWKHLKNKNSIKILFLDTLITLYNKKLEKIQTKLLKKEKKKKIKKKEKYEYWLISKELKKKENFSLQL